MTGPAPEDDVLVVGAGPAGAVAALALARAGVRVRLVDRARFPRPKLCGDSLNPGALAHLRRLGLDTAVEPHALRIHGMQVTGAGVVVDVPYPEGVYGLSIRRDRLDLALVERAVAAGAAFEQAFTVREPVLVDGPAGRLVAGVRGVTASGTRAEVRARVTIAADGRRSALAFALGLARHPASPRRWAVGAYMSGVASTDGRGEMHIRHGHYVGIAPVADGTTNVCVVRRSRAADPALASPERLLIETLAADPILRRRLDRPACVARPLVLGPLAVDAVGDVTAPDGLLVAGDAAGFIDPMTGDGMRFALRSGELAALAAVQALAGGWSGVHARLARQRQREFAGKWRLNRALRALVGSASGVTGAALGARLAPAAVRALVTHASDCGLARTA